MKKGAKVIDSLPGIKGKLGQLMINKVLMYSDRIQGKERKSQIRVGTIKSAQKGLLQHFLLKWN